MDANGKPKPVFSLSISFLRWFTLIVSLASLIVIIFFCPYQIQRYNLTTPCWSFGCGLFFVLTQYFANSDKWLYEKYRPLVFTVLGFVELPLALLWAVFYGMLYDESRCEIEYPRNPEYYRRMTVPSVYTTMALAQMNTLGFAALAIGLLRWLFVEMKIMEKIRLGFSQVEVKWPVSDRAFSIRGNYLRFLSLITAIGSATLGYIYCNPVGIDAVWIISVASCIVSCIFILGGLIGVLEKLEELLPLLAYLYLATEVILSAIVGIFHGCMYALCIIQMTTAGGAFKNHYSARTAATFVMLLAGFNVIFFAALVYALIRRAFAGRNLAGKFLPFPTEIDVDPKDPMTPNVEP